MKKGLTSLIGIVVGLVFILVAFFGPWWSADIGVSMPGMGDSDMHEDLYLTKGEITSNFMGQTISQSIDYADVGNLPQYGGAQVALDIFSIFTNSYYLVIGVIIMAILSLIGVLMFIFELGKANLMRIIGVVFGIIAFILILVVICYFTIGFHTVVAENGFPFTTMGETTTYDAGFWININTDDFHISGGPAYAWYLMIIAGITSLISSVGVLKTSVVSKAPEFVRVVPTEEKKPKKIITIMKNVKCPSCGKLIWVKGIANTSKTVICPECHTKVFCRFPR